MYIKIKIIDRHCFIFYSFYPPCVSKDLLVHMYLKGVGPPIIKGTGLYKLILVLRGFILTVHIVVWVITLIIRFCCSIYHEILLFPKKLRAFWGTTRAHKSPQLLFPAFIHLDGTICNKIICHMPYFIVRNQKLTPVIRISNRAITFFGPD